MVNSRIISIVEELNISSSNIPKIWDGRNAILEMREGGSNQWRQMEWMGFYFEYLCEKHFGHLLEIPGKKYANTEFDAFNQVCWDFKAHAANTTRHDVVTNDVEAIKNALEEYGYYGIILAIGEVEYNDEERTFKRWHDELKEGISKYETNRINRGAMSRRRKTEFVLSEIHFICLDLETLNQCSSLYHQGRNSNGKPRPPKYNVNIQKIPDTALIATKEY